MPVLSVPSVLVVHGSTRGGTEGLAAMIAEAFRRRGHAVTVSPANDVLELGSPTAVVVAGALYSSRWHRDARRFVALYRQELGRLPVWLVASGPLDGSAATEDIPPVRQVVKAAESVRARGTATFGGRLRPDATGFPASSMAKTRAGDWRDAEHVDRWVAQVCAELDA